MKSPHSRKLTPTRRVFLLLPAYSLVWFVLTGADHSSWIIGGPAVLLAVSLSLFLSPGTFMTVNPVAVIFFIPYFIFLSILSGIDVLRRTFSRGPRINPGILNYRTGLRGPSRVLLANIISLLPGTLSADLRDDEILVHLLDTEIPAEENLHKLENRIARIFPHHAGQGEQR